VSVALAAGKGTAALAAYQVAYQFFGFMAYLLDSLEVAAQSLVAKALGAADELLARATATRILQWAVGLGCLLGLLTVALAPVVSGWFSNEAEVVALLSSSLVLVGLIQPVAGVAYALDGILVGAADQRFLAVAMLGSSAVLGLGALVVAPLDDLWPLWLLLAVFMVTRVLFLGLRYRGSRWIHTGASM
jgi:Na+-driven multidrug efflux pump